MAKFSGIALERIILSRSSDVSLFSFARLSLLSVNAASSAAKHRLTYSGTKPALGEDSNQESPWQALLGEQHLDVLDEQIH